MQVARGPWPHAFGSIRGEQASEGRSPEHPQCKAPGTRHRAPDWATQQAEPPMHASDGERASPSGPNATRPGWRARTGPSSAAGTPIARSAATCSRSPAASSDGCAAAALPSAARPTPSASRNAACSGASCAHVRRIRSAGRACSSLLGPALSTVARKLCACVLCAASVTLRCSSASARKQGRPHTAQAQG